MLLLGYGEVSTMDFFEKLLTKAVDTSHEMIGKYERGEATPSIEAAKKIADAFGVSLDYLVGEGQHATYDKEMVKRLDQIEELPEEEK
jgi:transcriptional regulator with XRE-family HTH domain